MSPNEPLIIIGGGFTGLSAAYELSKTQQNIEILESEEELGGLAGTFEVQPGCRIEKFYHHWFTSDRAVLDLIEELGLTQDIHRHASKTGLYHANGVFRLSSPLELLRFPAIPLMDRVRTGLMALYARRINNWRALEGVLAKDWIRRIGGRAAYEVVWKPLLKGKFGPEADNISAVWFWNKLKLRGGSRGEKGREELLYLGNSFGALIAALRSALEKRGVRIRTRTEAQQIMSESRIVQGVLTNQGFIKARGVLATVPLPVFLRLTPELPPAFREQCSQIRFLGNVCLVLFLKRSLSETYWLNVADPTFPFVGIIEHTNLERADLYGGRHVAYISKYLSVQDELFRKSDDELFEYCLPYIKKIFPQFSREWISGHKVWRAHYSQPVITTHYSRYVPPKQTPIRNLWLATMAQIYPEDRGTNYAVREGREVAKLIAAEEA